MDVTDGMNGKAVNGSSGHKTGPISDRYQEMNMSNGKPAEPMPERGASSAMPDYIAFAKWLLSSELCLEVMMLASDLPTVATVDHEAELDSGVWFLCRADLPRTDDMIVRFVGRAAQAAETTSE